MLTHWYIISWRVAFIPWPIGRSCHWGSGLVYSAMMILAFLTHWYIMGSGPKPCVRCHDDTSTPQLILLGEDWCYTQITEHCTLIKGWSGSPQLVHGTWRQILPIGSPHWDKTTHSSIIRWVSTQSLQYAWVIVGGDRDSVVRIFICLSCVLWGLIPLHRRQLCAQEREGIG